MVRRKSIAHKGKGLVQDSPPSSPSPPPPPPSKRTRGTSSQTRRPPPPPPPPPPQVNEGDEEEEEVVDLVGVNKFIKAGMYLDFEELAHTPIVSQLDKLGFSLFAQFKNSWYHELVEDFYTGFRFGTRGDGVRLSYTIGDSSGSIDENDVARLFGLSRGVSDYPEKGYSSKWPIDVDACITKLNNGRPAFKSNMVYKYNLTGEQKLAFKVVMDVLLPTNSGASELSASHLFLTCAILDKVPVNLPAFILKHIYYQSKKQMPHPYGMVISHLLMDKKVPVDKYTMSRVNPLGRIGTQSLGYQELYWWNDKLWSKWEVFEKFELERKHIWAANKCSEPAVPKGWLPRRTTEGEPATFSVPRPSSEAGTSSSSAAAPTRPSTASLSQRALTELIFDHVWRQTEFLKEVSEHLGLTDRFGYFFDGVFHEGPQPQGGGSRGAGATTRAATGATTGAATGAATRAATLPGLSVT